jgi:hypothetical protein
VSIEKKPDFPGLIFNPDWLWGDRAFLSSDRTPVIFS